ncbi:MAG: glycosyltransferase [Bacteroidaceae bacterium]|nr:glycosyltransferase [Bacteroidaceae bacterium]
MLSILIPVKNYDCHRLIEELHRQGEQLGTPYEILVGEDGTSTDNIELNKIADTLPHCRRVVKEQNVGRAAMRNLLAGEAKHPCLIFLDCDAKIEREGFLARYAVALETSDVVCGGLYHADRLPDSSCTLRHKYEKAADKLRDPHTRSKAPYDKFSTFNFAIKKEIFETIRFDESITRYGHEDTLFGRELERRGIAIKHIDNSLLHCGLENNAAYLSKVEQSLATLAEIKEKMGGTPLTKAADKLRRYRLTPLFMLFWRACRPCLVKNLLGGNPSLTAFNIYKLGYYIKVSKRRRKKQTPQM